MAIKYYTKQYAGILPDLFEKKTPFLRVFGGTLQVKSDAEYNENFMDLKISDTDVTIQQYSKDPNVAFGTGTGNSNRFGPRKEVKSVDETVPWEEPLSIHEGIDKFTVNDMPDQVAAERLALHAVAWAGHVNTWLGKAISDNASETLTGELTEVGATSMFADARKKFINNKVSSSIAWVAYVTADVYNFLIDSELAKTDKNSSVNIDNQTLYRFKGFELVELPDDQFITGENAYFTAIGIGVVGVGIEVARALDSEDFNGVALQGAGQYAKYIPEKNKKAILKATLTAPTP
ncbi:capsid protein [uncultured Enterococcus sp.]|uniref:capsid protein n=1 Tax=uncultured Enterococcus sp. TaxID=167972 RepID=UPI002AA5E7B6|nr:capsid protein [uncultured Enterococcus sp.]